MGLSFFYSSYSLFLEYELIRFITIPITFLVLLDWLSLVFMGAVLLISSVVFLYTQSYLSSDKSLYKFIMLVFLFVLSILILILSPNIISILLGWDGLGLASYCLVIYYQNIKSANAGMLTVLSNRLGDIAILLRICWFLNYGSCRIHFLQFTFYDKHLFYGFILVFLACLTKRAQIPFSAWLPAAIAAPTPVSSLVHSSTLVTAGVYLLVRFHGVLEYNYILYIISILTIFMSGLGANYETDLKRVIALSTLRQLGVIILVLSLGAYELALLHLLSHALFKSLLFLCAGFYIHRRHDTQDSRLIGSLSFYSPVISLFFFTSSISLCGFPFITGFYSKDLVLEIIYISYMNFPFFILLFISTLLTLSYSIRLSFFTSFITSSSSRSSLEDDRYIFIPMMALFIMSTFGGCLIVWTFFPCVYSYLRLITKTLTLLFLALSFVVTVFHLRYPLFSHNTTLMIYYFRLIWMLPLISIHFSSLILFRGISYVKFLDQGWIEYLGGQGLYSKIYTNSASLNIITNSLFKNIFLFFIFSVFILSVIIYFNSLN